MRIRDKFFIVIIAIAAINLFFFVSISFLNIKDFLQSSVSRDLEHVAEARKQEIEVFFENIKNDLLIAQGYYNFKKNLPVVDSLSDDKLNKNYIESKNELDGQMKVLQGIKKFKNIILLNPKGETVYFSDTSPMGEYESVTRNYISDVFAKGKDAIYLSDPIRGILAGNTQSYFMLAAAPVFDENKNFIGEVVFDVSLDNLFDSIQNGAFLGQTGEVAVGKKINDKEILVLNPLRHDPNAALNKKILIGSPLGEGLQKAIRDISGVGIITDYRGAESLASWYQIPTMGWGVVVKIDEAEAFMPITQLRNILALLVGIEALVVIFFVFFMAKSITDPLVELHKGTEIIARGDLNYKVGIKTRDEVGQLSRAFDEMIDKLKDAQFMYSELIETTPLCIKVFDANGKLIFINKGGRDEHFLKNDTDISKWDWLGDVAEPYRAVTKEKFERALGGESGVVEFQHIPGRSKHEWCSGVLNPVKGEDGKVKTVLFYSTDITALRHVAIDLENRVKERTAQIESEKEKFLTLVDQLPVGVVMVSAEDGNVIEINKKAEDFFGSNVEAMLNKGSFFKTINFVKDDGSPYPTEELPMYHAISKGESSMRDDLCIKKSNGVITNFRGMAVPLRDSSGKVIYGIGVLEDITKEKSVEKMRKDFLSLASHQLRTPLSGTKWLVETLQTEKFGVLNPKQKQYLQELDHVNERMIRLVFDMLNALKFEGGSLEIRKEKINIYKVFDDVLGMMDSAAKKKGIVIQNLLKETSEFIIETDISLIKPIFESLVSNALEYSKSGQTIIVNAAEEAGGYIISVRDFGIGIPESEKTKMFEKFYRASNAKSARPDGTGLGLYIASMLAERIDVKIDFESVEGEGTTFYLHVPKEVK